MLNFIHIKYKPKILDNFYILNNTKNNLIELSKYNYLDNILLYGNNGSCKKTMLNCFLNNYFNNSNSIYNTQTINFTLKNNYNHFYKVSSKHFEFTLVENIFINKAIISEIIYPLIKNNSIINKQLIIIIYNIEKLNYKIEFINNILKQNKKVVFLLTSNKYIFDSNNFIQIKCNINNYFDLLKISLQIIKDYKLNINNNIIKKYILNSNYNINTLLNIYQDIINNNILNKNNILINNTKNYDINLIDKIIDILLKKNINDLPIIKNIINNILLYKYYNIKTIIEIIYNNIIPYINNKHSFIYELSTLNTNMLLYNENNNIILLDTIILCIYNYL